ncbi:MAG: hypothetical protein OXH59_16775 [Rhodospirillaceae bacterium]|nr:hypothetical protein [Rhodospirillaceae bacterium]
MNSASSPSAAPSDAALGLAALRGRIAMLERRSPRAGSGSVCQSAVAGSDAGSNASGAPRPWRTGIYALDAALPAAGLAPGGVHEAAGAGAADRPAALAFLAALLVRLGRRGPVSVCQGPGGVARLGRLYGPGWRDLGLEPADLLVVETRRERDALWAMEESLRSGAAAAVLGETERLAFVSGRRLALAAREGGTPLLLLRGDGLDGASAAFSRWRVTALPPERADPFDAASFDATSFDAGAPGPPRWRLELLRCRGGRPATCDAQPAPGLSPSGLSPPGLSKEENRETGDFGMAALLADRPAAPRPTVRRPAFARAAG